MIDCCNFRAKCESDNKIDMTFRFKDHFPEVITV